MIKKWLTTQRFVALLSGEAELCPLVKDAAQRLAARDQDALLLERDHMNHNKTGPRKVTALSCATFADTRETKENEISLRRAPRDGHRADTLTATDLTVEQVKQLQCPPSKVRKSLPNGTLQIIQDKGKKKGKEKGKEQMQSRGNRPLGV